MEKPIWYYKLPIKFQVVGVPVTTNGDLKNQFVETNVGFDTICKVNANFNFLVTFVAIVANMLPFSS